MNREKFDRKSSLEKTRRFVVKVGTSSLTDDSSKLDIGKVANLVSMLMREKESGRTPILVSSGAIGAGLGKMGHPERPAEVHELQAAKRLSQGGIAMVIANTNTPDALAKVLRGEIGTLFMPQGGIENE